MALSHYAPRYTVEEYALWEGEWELWSGAPVAMSPSPGMIHQTLVYRVTRALDDALKKGECRECRVYFDIDWRVSGDTVLRPDVSVICGASRTETHLEQTPVFVAEILSESTRQRDLLYKRAIYEQLGVRYYLIVDPQGELTLLQREGERYHDRELGRLNLEVGCEIDFDLTGLFEEL